MHIVYVGIATKKPTATGNDFKKLLKIKKDTEYLKVSDVVYIDLQTGTCGHFLAVCDSMEN